MNKKYKVLVLTDHSGHSKENSIYSLLKEMLRDSRCESIHIGSRGLKENADFFYKQDAGKLFTSIVDDSFAFTSSGKSMKKHLRHTDVTSFDLVFMRMPRPIEDDFLMWISEIIPNAVFVNKPLGIIKTSSKRFLLKVSQYCPPIRLCHSISDIKEFAKDFPIVLKPLNEYGGKGLLKVQGNRIDDGSDDFEMESYLDKLKGYIERDGYLAMKYLQNVSKGDKRILVVDGGILASSLRLPAAGSWLCNVAQGGTSVPTEPTEKERNIVEGIAPILRENGILIYGVDTLMDDEGHRVLSEINSLSVGGFPQAEAQTGLPVLKTTIKKIFDYADKQ